MRSTFCSILGAPVKIEHLKPKTMYEFHVSVQNPAGESKARTLRITTPDGPAESTQGASAAAVYTSTLLLALFTAIVARAW